jgi:PHD/YefM family antitoxin component YafN of YafNO toxin-antitoxin module
MNRASVRKLVVVLSALSVSGCVSASTYERAVQEAMQARLKNQETIRDLAESKKQMKQRIEDLEARLRDANESLIRTERERVEVRDELLKIKMDREQQIHRIRERLKISQKQLEKEKAALETEASIREKSQAQSEETKRRLKDLMQEIQGLLDQLEQSSK